MKLEKSYSIDGNSTENQSLSMYTRNNLKNLKILGNNVTILLKKTHINNSYTLNRHLNQTTKKEVIISF